LISKLIFMFSYSFVLIWLSMIVLSWAFDFKYSLKIVVGVWAVYVVVFDLLRLMQIVNDKED